MAIYQPFLNSQVSGASVPQPSNSFAGIEAIGGAVDSLAKLATEGIKAFSSDVETQQRNRYYDKLETARGLLEQGKTREARDLVRGANIELARAGFDPAKGDFKQIRLDLGFDDDQMDDPEERVLRSIRKSPEYEGILQGIYSRAWKESRLNGTEMPSFDEMESMALAEHMETSGMEARLRRKETEGKLTLPDYMASVERISSNIFTMLWTAVDSGKVLSEEEILNYKGVVEQARLEAYKYADTPEKRKLAEDRFNELNSTFEILEKNSSLGFVQERWAKDLTLYFLDLASDPDDPHEFNMNDFNWYMQNIVPTNMRDYATLMQNLVTIGGADGGRMKRFESAMGAFTSSLRLLEDGTFNLEGRDFTDANIDMSNKLKASVEKIREERGFLAADSFKTAAALLPGNMDAPDLVDPAGAKNYAVKMAWAAASVDNAVKEGGFISAEGMNTLFSDANIRYMQELSKTNPELFADAFDYLTAASSNYRTSFQNRLTQLRNQLGVVFDEDGSIRLDMAAAEASGVFRLGSQDGKEKWFIEARKVYGEGSDEEVFKRMLADGGLKLESYFSKKQITEGMFAADTAIADSVHNTIRGRLYNLDPEENKNIFLGQKRLSEFVGRVYAGSFERPQLQKINAELKEFAPLIPLLNKTEAKSYTTLWGNSNEFGGQFAGVDITKMTVNQLLKWVEESGYRDFATAGARASIPGYKDTTAPLGKYQIVPRTLEQVMTNNNISKNRLFDESLQDELFVLLARWRLKNSNGNIDEAMKQFGLEWQGLQGEEVQKQLRAALEQIMGVTPNEE